MHTEFLPLDLAHAARYESLWHACPQQSMDYTLVNLWGWQEYTQMSWNFSGKLCWLAPKADESNVLWAPVGPWQEVDFAKEPLLAQGAKLVRVPEELAFLLEKALPGRVVREENRDQFEYLYDRNALATLPGNKYQKKRNHVNGFKKMYGEPDYRPMDDAVVEDMLSLQDEWCKWHECNNSASLLAENVAINKVLSHWHDFSHLMGGALYVDDAMVAFSVGEILDNGTLGVHFEKGHSGFRGVYQTMNTLFVQRAGEGCNLVNREQDMGEEGLRQAKMTYFPVEFLRKYTLTIQPA